MTHRSNRSLLGVGVILLVALPAIFVLTGAGQPAPRPTPVPLPIPRPQLLARGGQVHGYVIVWPGKIDVTGATLQTVPYIRLPQAHVYLKALPAGTVVAGSDATTNAHGFFIVPKKPAGRYQLCVDATGYAPACDSKPISLSSGTVVLDHDVLIAPKAGFVRGHVQLKDGQVSYQENQLFRTLVPTKVTLVDAGGNVASGPVFANSMGFYVLPNITATGALTTRPTHPASSA